MYNSEEKAILFIMNAFKGKKEKISDIEKVALSLLVGLSIKKITNDKDTILAAYLHNIINYSNYGKEEIEEKFNKEVAHIVAEISEDWSLTRWVDRKKDFLDRLKANTDPRCTHIIIAEKTQELLSFRNNYYKKKDKIWKELKISKSEATWFYRSIYSICANKNINTDLLYRYKQEILYYFGDVE